MGLASDGPVDAIWLLSWRAWPATALVLGGIALALRAVWAERRGMALPSTDPHKGVAFVRALRGVLVGLAAAVMGVAWIWQLDTVFLVAAVIGGEELLETSVVVAALDDAERRGVWSHVSRNCAGRFSRNATTPSRKSPLCAARI
jgi:hypothetical protein